jgi:hypothetical protein
MRAVLSEAFQASSGGFSIPAPIGGWNARDSLAQMPSTDAIYLDNWFPATTEVVVRPGSAVFATLPTTAAVKSLLSCATQSGVSKLFAASDTGVFDVTAGGAVAVASYVITDGRVEALNLNIAGEPWLWCCNGVNDCFLYKSSTGIFQALNAVTVPALTGITSSDVTNVSLWKQRVILTKKNSLSFYYLPLNSVGGAAVEYPMGAVFRLGGYLVATANWSIDGGDGQDDRLIAISSEGEVAVFQGTNPAVATEFGLIGVFHIGRPIGKRCVITLSGDLAVLTESGLWPLSKALLSSTIDRRPALTDRIRDAFNNYFKLYGTLFGWQPILYSAGPALLVNIPLSATISEQFVMNTLTGAWCRFQNWNARCLGINEGVLYFAQGNTVYSAWEGTSDSSAAIVANAKTAFSYGPSKSRSKHIKLVRTILRASQNVIGQLALDTNFKDKRTVSSYTNRGGNEARWDEARWDQAAWVGGEVTMTQWKTVSHAPGKAFALRLRLSVKGIDASWVSTDYITQTGSLLG